MILTSETKTKLEILKLNTLASCIEQYSEDANIDLRSLQDWLNALLDVQISHNQSMTFSRMRKIAKLRWPDATFATSERLCSVLQSTIVSHLQSCKWIEATTHVVLSGKSSSGKTHLACSIGNQAILMGFRVQFFRYRDLLIILRAADNEGNLIALIKKLLRVDLIIIDDWTIDKLPRQEQAVLFELVEKREKRGSFVITTQFDPAAIHKAIGGDAIADAILSRLIPLAQRIELSHNIDFREIDMQVTCTHPKKKGDSKC